MKRSRRVRLAGLMFFLAALGVLTGVGHAAEPVDSGVGMVYAGGEYPGTGPH